MQKQKLRVLLFDVETSPNLGWVWGKYEQNVLAYEKESHLLTFSYKWLGEKKTYGYGLPDFATYKKDKEDDRELVGLLWKLFDEADIIIGHNGDAFDIKRTNARFLYHGFEPTKPHKTIDTLKVVRKYFKLNSNKLNDVCGLLGIGGKVETGGFSLWLDCMNGDMKAWKKMIKYNKQDVVLLEKLYLRIRGWIHNHPNVNLLAETPCACPKCGSPDIIKRGFGYTKVGKFQNFQCKECGGWSREKVIRTGVTLTT